VTIIEDDEVPSAGVIQFSGANYQVDENAGTLLLTITRTNGSFGSASVDVDVTTVDGTAIAGEDYLAASETLMFLDGDTSQTILITIFDDADYAGDESFNVVLSNLIGDATLGNPSTATITIVEDEAVPASGILQLSGDDYSVSEGQGSVTITVQRIDGSYGDVSVDYSITDGTAINGSDYSSADGTLYFINGETSQTITVDIVDDRTDEATESFVITLSNPSNTTLGDIQTATVAIEDNDETAVVQLPRSNNGGGSVSVLWLFFVSCIFVHSIYRAKCKVSSIK